MVFAKRQRTKSRWELYSWTCGICNRSFVSDRGRLDNCPLCAAERSLYLVGSRKFLPKSCIFIKYGDIQEDFLKPVRRNHTIEKYNGLKSC